MRRDTTSAIAIDAVSRLRRVALSRQIFVGFIFAFGSLSALFWHWNILRSHVADASFDELHLLLRSLESPIPSSLSSHLPEGTGVPSVARSDFGGGDVNSTKERRPTRNVFAPKPYIFSPLCRVCAHETVADRRTCGDEIRERVLNRWKALREGSLESDELKQTTFNITGSKIPPDDALTPDFDLPELSAEETVRMHDDVRLVAGEVARLFPDECGSCDPAQCPGGTKYFRFDSVAPRHERAVTHALPSVPDSARVPPDVIGDDGLLLRWLQRQWDGSDPWRDWLFEYNPSLVHLPPSVAAKIGLGSFQHSEKGGVVEYYLASFRLSSANECFSKHVFESINGSHWNEIRGAPNFLGLAVLDTNLTIVPGYDVVVDLEKGLGFEKDEKAFMDFRLFVSKDDRIWLNINGRSAHITEIEISGKDQTNEAVRERAFPNLYGYGISVSASRNFSTVWTGGIHGKNYALFQTPDMTDDNSVEFFAEINTWPNHEVQRLDPSQFAVRNLSEIWMRLYPNSGAGRYQWADSAGFRKNGLYQRKYDIWRRQMREVGKMVHWNVSETNLTRSTPTVDELWFPRGSVFKNMHHGGACCVEIPIEMFSVGSLGSIGQRPVEISGPALPGIDRTRDDPIRETNEGRVFRASDLGVEHLLVGVGHNKIPWRPFHKNNKQRAAAMPHTQYVSFFYAFVPQPPYEIRLASGYFCLGHSDAKDEDGSGIGMNPYVTLTFQHLMKMNNETFACPRIHYVSGIVDKIGDNSTAVISYGVNDCTPRVLEVNKSEIVRQLLGHMHHDFRQHP